MRIEERVEQWPETTAGGNANVVIGKENYFLRVDGLLMRRRKISRRPIENISPGAEMTRVLDAT